MMGAVAQIKQMIQEKYPKKKAEKLLQHFQKWMQGKEPTLRAEIHNIINEITRSGL
jgi:hypothetical protein